MDLRPPAMREPEASKDAACPDISAALPEPRVLKAALNRRGDILLRCGAVPVRLLFQEDGPSAAELLSAYLDAAFSAALTDTPEEPR